MPTRPQVNANAMPMGEILCGRVQEESFCGGLRMESFREGVQGEPFLWDVSIGILRVGVQLESLCKGRCWNSPAQCQRSANAMPH
eukprot:7266860-Pyramimonas_sp.AAC.1